MRSSRGNALFLILIAVALFAALSYAITSSGRGGGNIEKEKLQLGANQIAQYFALIQHEVQKLMIVSGCQYNNLDWRNSNWERIDGSPAAGILSSQSAQVAKSGCAVFDEYGGPVPSNVTFEDMGLSTWNDNAATWQVKAGHLLPLWVSKSGEGSSETDIAIEVRGLQPDVCSYLVDPKTKPTPYNENYSSNPALSSATPSYTGESQVIDETLNAGYFYMHEGISTGPGSCLIGAVIVAR